VSMGAVFGELSDEREALRRRVKDEIKRRRRGGRKSILAKVLGFFNKVRGDMEEGRKGEKRTLSLTLTSLTLLRISLHSSALLFTPPPPPLSPLSSFGSAKVSSQSPSTSPR